MSAHRTHTAAHTRVKRLTALAVSAAAVWLALAATPAAAVDQPELPRGTTATAPTSGPPNYPNYEPKYEVPRVESVVQRDGGLEATSVALGALGGIALAGAGVGIAIQRRRDHATPDTV